MGPSTLIAEFMIWALASGVGVAGLALVVDALNTFFEAEAG
jgi:hypothetical protein